MAFPSERSQASSSSTAAETTHTVNLPGTIRAGDVILVFIRVAVAGAIGWPDATWNELFDGSPDASDDQVAAAWRKADGTEGATISVTSGNGKFVSMAYAYRDAADPTLTPPDQAAATGGGGTEPDSPSLVASGGTKDYYWLSIYSMEGEQTGITAYPANYTLNQSGIVTTGTGGAVTTNCTMASAGRQVNGASENPGIWDVTGTLDDWAAYTFAIHPAAVIPAPLDRAGARSSSPTHFSPRLPASAAVLTVAVNLLQTTLAPTNPPIVPIDYPNPSRITSQLLVDMSSRPQEDGVPPFIPVDWRNPDLRKYQPIIFDYKLLPLIAPEEQAPFPPVDWSIPQVKQTIRQDWIQSRPQFAVDESPFNQYNWPNPFITKRGQDWIDFKQLEEPVNFPFIPISYPNPIIGGKQNTGSVHERPQYYIDAFPYNQYNWPNPSPFKKPALTWIVNLLENTLAPVGVQPIFSSIYALPLIKPRLIVDIATSPRSEPGETPLISQIDWPNPLRRKRFVQDHRFWYIVDTNLPPVAQVTNIPLRKRLIAQTWIQPALLASPISSLPVGHSYYEIPLVKGRPTLTWLSDSLAVGDVPLKQTEWPNPVLRARAPVIDWVQEKPFFYEESFPSRQLVWPNPLIKRVAAISYIFIPQLSDTELQRNFDNPNPLLKIRPTLTHIDNLLNSTLFPGEGAIPTIPGVTPNPVLRELHEKGFIFWYVVDDAIAIPVTPIQFPNPQIARKPVIDWKYFFRIQESLRGTSVMEVPLSKKRNIIDWVQNLQQTTLGPIPFTSISQKDWPNPLRKARNVALLTHISDNVRNTAGDKPFGFIEWPIPLKRKIALSWIYNPVLTLNVPAGAVPFSQKDWPLVVRVRRGGQDYIQRAYILPEVGGRVICLLADATEYQLEATIEIYDLDARFEIYDLEAGGDECQ